MSKRKISVSARALAALLPFVSKEETRFYLTGIKIEPSAAGGVLLIATDGRAMGVIHDAKGSTDGEHLVSIPANLAKIVKSRAGLNGTAHFIGNVVHVVSDEMPPTQNPEIISPHHLHSCHAPDIDGDFPTWRLVFGHGKPVAHDGYPNTFNVYIIEKFRECGKALNGLQPAPMSIHAPEAACPALVHMSAQPESGLAFTGLIMPMSGRDPEEIKLAPAWLAAPAPIAPAKGKRAKPAPTPKAA